MLPKGAEWHPRNMRDCPGQCERNELLWAEKSAGSGINCRGRQAPRMTKTPMKYGFFAMARRLLRNWCESYVPRMPRPLLESCHVPSPWRCVIGHRRPQGADVDKTVDRRQPGRVEPVRFLRGCIGIGGIGGGIWTGR